MKTKEETMKKFSLIALITSSMLFVACGNKTKDAAEAAKNSVTEATTKAVDATKEATAKATDAAAEAAKAAKEKAAKLAEETKAAAEKAAAEAKAKAEELAKAAEAKAAEAKAATEKAAAEAKAKAAEAAEAVKTKAAEAAEATKEKVVDAVSSGDAEGTKEAAAAAVDTAAGAALYAKCAGCHGKDGKTKALGKSVVIAGQESAALVESIKGYKAGTRNVNGMGTLMKGQVASMSDGDIEAVAAYISTLK
jgi:cytochrome c553